MHSIIKNKFRSSCHGAVVNESVWEPWDCGFDPWPFSVGWGSGVSVSCGVIHRRGSDPVLLWLWHRLVATASIRPLAWEPPYAVGAALQKAKKTKNQFNYVTISSVIHYVLLAHYCLSLHLSRYSETTVIMSLTSQHGRKLLWKT